MKSQIIGISFDKATEGKKHIECDNAELLKAKYLLDRLYEKKVWGVEKYLSNNINCYIGRFRGSDLYGIVFTNTL